MPRARRWERIDALSGAFPARFLERPNRFLLRCRRESDGGELEAFLPNPGRLRELLLPHVRLWIAEAPPGNPRRKTAFTAVAVERADRPIFLHTHLNNEVARRLIDGGGIPGLQGWRVRSSEVKVGHSRFDFLLEGGGKELLLEVKSVTLFGGEVAMFPDAVTARGRRHLLELAELRAGGRDGAVLFLAHGEGLRWFMPDFHTDLAFARTFMALRNELPMYAVALQWNEELRFESEGRRLEIPWACLERELHDRGLVLASFRVGGRECGTKGQGTAEAEAEAFRPGWWLCVVEASKDLSRVLEGIRRGSSRPVDALGRLRSAASAWDLLPIRGEGLAGKELEADLIALFGEASLRPPGDGAAAPRFFHLSEDPMTKPAFHALLEGWRMARPLAGRKAP